MSNFLSPNDPSETLLKQKLELGEQMSSIIEGIDETETFDETNMHFVFDSPESLQRLWLPIGIDSYALMEHTRVKRVELTQRFEADDARPITVVSVFFTNGERTIFYRDPSDSDTTAFRCIASYDDDREESVNPSDVGYLIASLILRAHKVDYNELAYQAQENHTSQLDPTNGAVAKMFQQNALTAADAYSEKNSRFVEFEDDRYGVDFRRRTESTGLTELTATFIQEDPELDTRVLEIEAKSQLFPGETSDQAGISYEKWSGGVKSDAGFGDQDDHLYDFMLTAIKQVRDLEIQPYITEEQL